MNRELAVLGGVLLALSLSACGGGGGGGLPPPPAGPPATGTINTGSVLAVSGRSVDAAIQSGGFGGITDFVGLTTVATSNPGNFESGNAAKPVGWYVQMQIPVGPETSACLVSGTVTVSGDIASPLTVTAGDFLDYEWDSCDNGLGQIIHGFIGMTFTEFDGNLLAGQILLGVSLVVEDFQVREGGQLNVTDGGLSLTIDSRDQPETVITTNGSSLIVRNSAGSDELTDFSITVTEDGSVFPSNFTTDATGTLSSTLFNGFVTYNMPTPFQATGDGYPYVGEMIVFGTNNSRVRIIAVSAVDVRIEADYDGDGASDATIDTTWAALVDG